MIFKNFIVYTLNQEAQAQAVEKLTHETLASHALKPRHKTQETSIGWVPPLKSVNDSLIYEIDGARFVKLGIESALISSNAINKETRERIAAAIKTGNDLDKTQENQIADAVKTEHIAAAKTEISYAMAYFDNKAGRLIVAGGTGQGELITKSLRLAMEGFACAPLRTEKDATYSLQSYLLHNTLPTYEENGQTRALLTFGEHFKFSDNKDKKRTVTVNDSLEPELTDQLCNCRNLTEVALEYKHRAFFKMTDKLAFKGLGFTDLCLEEFQENMGDTSADDPAITRMFLEVNEIRQLLNDLIALFGGLPKPAIPKENS